MAATSSRAQLKRFVLIIKFCS